MTGADAHNVGSLSRRQRTCAKLRELRAPAPTGANAPNIALEEPCRHDAIF
jgi:hypothetical protein